jgi:phosphopantothenoylcysteine decarboxylase/phosphopantothenate--cysteine ligase
VIPDRHVLLGVSGGIACYKTCSIVRLLVDAGAKVDVVMTASAAEFVRPVTFEALSGRPVLTSLWQRDQALAHIQLGRESELIVVAPATANLLARAACGIADDLLTAILLAARVPILAAPAMNDSMYDHPATAANLGTLSQRRWTFVGPDVGPLAEGPSERPGRMAEPEFVFAHIERGLRAPGSVLSRKRVLVTAGATREWIDPVRVITNPSSGRMGFAVAAAAFARGADVTLISGAAQTEPPAGIVPLPVRTTAEMLETVGERLPETDVLVMAAAPADYKPRGPASAKLPRAGGPLALELEPTADILESTVPRRPKGMVAVGFALETDGGVERARAKLQRKRLDLIVLNSAMEPGSGFETDTNRATLVSADSVTELPLLSKRLVAERLLDRVEELL